MAIGEQWRELKQWHLTPKCPFFSNVTPSFLLLDRLGQMAIFSPGWSTYFFGGYDISREEFFQRKKVGVTHQKMYMWSLGDLFKKDNA